MPPPTVTYVLSSMTLSHFRPASFKILGGVITFLLSFSLGTYFYCAPNSARCRNNGVWDGGAWGGYACRTEYCEASCVEEDFPDMFIKARSLGETHMPRTHTHTVNRGGAGAEPMHDTSQSEGKNPEAVERRQAR